MKQTKHKKKFNENEAEALWELLKNKDLFTAEHTRRVSEMTKKFADGTGWKTEDARNLASAALIHDVAKLDIPDELFEKMKIGKELTEDEIETVRQHAGNDLILREYGDVPQIVKDVLKYHHERFDGSGYPNGISGEEIPLGVRMLSIADFYDTIVVQRPWKTPKLQKPLNEKDAIKLLIEESVIRFDPDLVSKFISVVLKPSA